MQTTSQALQSIIHVSNFELSRSTHRHKLSYGGTVGRIKTHLRRKTCSTTYEPSVTLFILLFFPLFVLVIVQFHLLVHFPLPAGTRSEDAKTRRRKLLLCSAGRERTRNLSKNTAWRFPDQFYTPQGHYGSSKKLCKTHNGKQRRKVKLQVQ